MPANNKDFRDFVLKLYMESTEEKVTYKLPTPSYSAFVDENRWWAKRAYKETNPKTKE